jgi:hypothetical protein
MNIKKMLFAGTIGRILFFLFGWVVYGILLKDYFFKNTGAAGHLDRVDIIMGTVFLGGLLQGYVYAFVFTRANVESLKEGMITGGILGFLMISAFNCMMYSTTLILSKHSLVADILASTFIATVVGAILGWILYKMKK